MASPGQDRQSRETTLQIEVSARANRRSVVAGLMAVMAMTALAAQRSRGAGNPWIWLAMAGTGQLVALWLLNGGLASLQSRFPKASPGRVLTALAVYCSFAWGASAWLLLPGQDPQREIVLIVAIAVIFVGGAAGIVYRPILLGLACTGPLVFATGLLATQGSERLLLAGGFILLSISTVLYSSSHIQAIRIAIRLGTENERLLADSTEQRRLADQARVDAEHARQSAVLADRGKTAFLAAAGHDLRQPMHALVQYQADLARRNTSPALDEAVGRIGKSLDAMRELLDAMLEVSKLLTGTVQPRMGPVALHGLMDRLDTQLRPLAQAKGLEFLLRAQACTIETDEVLLERILRNLMLNAVRYTSQGRIGIRCACRGQVCRILVWDTGIGIAKPEQSRIFDEFYQVANDARDMRRGQGLGLAIVRRLAQLLGHPIRVRSMPGRGSVFAVEMPISKTATSNRDTSAAETEPDFVRGAFVMLIDADSDRLSAMATTLRTFGARVLVAQSAQEGVARLHDQQFAPQLILSAYRLEGEPGLDAIHAITRDQKALYGDDFEIAALLITGDTAPDELLRAQAAGITMLHKPVPVERLYRELNQQLAALAAVGTAPQCHKE